MYFYSYYELISLHAKYIKKFFRIPRTMKNSFKHRFGMSFYFILKCHSKYFHRYNLVDISEWVQIFN